jgi:hypothetical protein
MTIEEKLDKAIQAVYDCRGELCIIRDELIAIQKEMKKEMKQ